MAKKPEEKQSSASSTDTTVPKEIPVKPWKPSHRFVDFKCRSFVVKLVDPENGFHPGQVMMTINGPAPTSHAKSIKIDKDGYMATSEKEEKALLKLANRATHGSKDGSYLVTWENREMPAEQRKAELTAHEYKKRIEDLQDQIADKPALEEENRKQAALIENLERQLAANKGG